MTALLYVLWAVSCLSVGWGVSGIGEDRGWSPTKTVLMSMLAGATVTIIWMLFGLLP